MRGGSSIFGKMFDTDPRSVLWYEPLDSFLVTYMEHVDHRLPSTLSTGATEPGGVYLN